MSSNSRELHAVLYSMMAAAPRLHNTVVLCETDNSTTMAYVNHLGGRSRFLSAVAHRLWNVTNSYGVTLRAVHRPGVENRRADLLGRWRQESTDLKHHPKFFRLADRQWGRHTVDLFATRLNTQLPRFVSWRPDPEAEAVDAFQFPLTGVNPWCFPPVGTHGSFTRSAYSSAGDGHSRRTAVARQAVVARSHPHDGLWPWSVRPGVLRDLRNFRPGWVSAYPQAAFDTRNPNPRNKQK